MYVRTLVCAIVFRFTCLTEKDQGVPDTTLSLLFRLLRFLFTVKVKVKLPLCSKRRCIG